MRIPPAAKTFIAEVKDLAPRASIEPFGDPDGLGVVRTLRAGKSASKRLAPILEVLHDPRIVEHHVTDAGLLHITFAPRAAADFTHPFDLADAEVIAKG